MKGCGLVVTVDCGTNAHLAAGGSCRGRARGDRRRSSRRRTAVCPRATAIVNPNRLDETSPHGSLAAVGVAFLLVVAVNRAATARRVGTAAAALEPDLLGWLDLVALGTVCDVVPLTGVNRALVAQGIKVARRNANPPGLAALAAVAGVNEPIDAYHLGFVNRPTRQRRRGGVGAADPRRAPARHG